jgi:hypothetical protein
MKFNNFDELITFLHGKDFSTLNFEITNINDNSIVDAGVPVVADLISNPENVKVTFNSFSDKPELDFTLGESSMLLVNEFHHVPNTCSVTKVTLAGRELTVGVCESNDGLPKTKFDVMIDGKLYGGKEFILVTDAAKYKNTINLNGN